MKKVFLFIALLFAMTISAQETYYGQIKKVSKTKKGSSTQINSVAVSIDEEYKLVYLSTGEPRRYKIIEQVSDETTGDTTYKLSLTTGDGTINATIIANTERAIFNDIVTKEKITFDSRYKKAIPIR